MSRQGMSNTKPSPSSNHRYTLRREWNQHKRGVINWIMLNPSTADDVFDDPTIRRCIGFSKRWGYSGLVVTNLFAYRATDPKEMINLAKRDLVLAVGDLNDNYIHLEAEKAQTVICAWGNNVKGFRRDIDVISFLHERRDLYCIRRTKEGNPAHPVREGYTDAPVLFHSCVGTEAR